MSVGERRSGDPGALASLKLVRIGESIPSSSLHAFAETLVESFLHLIRNVVFVQYDPPPFEAIEARLLTQPIYRVPADARTDAALFAFVQGTDPEVVLLVEAVNSTGWRYALARMTVVAIAADLNDARVWELPSNWSLRMAQDQPFRTVQLPGAQ